MKHLNKLRKTEALVKEVLENRVDSRDDDFILISEVYKMIVDKEDLETRTISNFLEAHAWLDLIPFESITRCRRKIMKKHPELQSTKIIKDLRNKEQSVYKEYALERGI